MRILELTVNEMRIIFIEMKRYWFETLIGYVFISFLFAGIFFGSGMATGGMSDESSKDALLFGFIVWVLIWQTYHSVGGKVTENTEKGFIEQLFMGDKSFAFQCVCKFIADFVINGITIVFLAYLFMLISNNWVDIDFPLLFGIVLLGLPAILGLGFAFAGVSLVFKKAGNLTILMMFLMVGVVAVDSIENNLYALLPFAHASALAEHLILKEHQFQVRDLIIIAANSVVYLVAGLVVYGLGEKYSRKNNLIGIY